MPSETNKSMILVVDDQLDLRVMVSSLLKRAGYDAVCAVESAEAAMSVLDHELPALIICDWNMPNVTGLDLLTFIRTRYPETRIPFMILTASCEPDKMMQAVKAGVSDYVLKHAIHQVLIDKVRGLMRWGPGTSEANEP